MVRAAGWGSWFDRSHPAGAGRPPSDYIARAGSLRPSDKRERAPSGVSGESLGFVGRRMGEWLGLPRRAAEVGKEAAQRGEGDEESDPRYDWGHSAAHRCATVRAKRAVRRPASIGQENMEMRMSAQELARGLEETDCAGRGPTRRRTKPQGRAAGSVRHSQVARRGDCDRNGRRSTAASGPQRRPGGAAPPQELAGPLAPAMVVTATFASYGGFFLTASRCTTRIS